MGATQSGHKASSSSRRDETPKSFAPKYDVPSAFVTKVNVSADTSSPQFKYPSINGNTESPITDSSGKNCIFSDTCSYASCKYEQLVKRVEPMANEVVEDNQKGGKEKMEKPSDIQLKMANEVVGDYQKGGEEKMEKPSDIQLKMANEVVDYNYKQGEEKMEMPSDIQLKSSALVKVDNKTSEKQKGSKERLSHIPCRYFSLYGGCKFGHECKFLHSKGLQKIGDPDLNFVGLPLRPGEKECIVYLQTGFCTHGSKCRFDHPNPIPVVESSSYGSIGNDQWRSEMDKSWHRSGEFSSMQFPLSSETSVLESLSHIKSDNGPSSASDVYSTSSAQQQEAEGNQVSSSDATEPSSLTYDWSYANPMSQADPFSSNRMRQIEEYPERPGKPECFQFIKTGCCKYGSRCWYHHPRRSPAVPSHAACVDANESPPQIPRKTLCWYYVSGFCRHGDSCSFLHPPNYISPVSPGLPEK